jgi:dTDP-4-amino-4,6-dideoxygalactose transaminase
MIQIASPIIGDEEIEAVNNVLSSGMLAQGPKVSELEESFARYCGTKFAVAVNSGTAAIHAALFAAGVGPGDEVITTPFSFIATINPILFLGAKPVLVDIDPGTYNIDVEKVRGAITNKTKVILPVHLYGQPCDFNELQALADEHGIIIIEDACQAVGANYGDKKAGSLGNLGCFSLYATKNIMCGEGGVVTTDDEKQATIMKSFRQHGMVGPYEYAGIGYNYRMTDLHAAIAVAQLGKVDDFSLARQNNAKILSEGLANIKGLELPSVKQGRTHVYHQYTVRITPEFSITREQLMIALREKEIGSAIYYPKPLHAYSHIAKLGYQIGDFPNAEEAAEQVLSLPVHPRVSAEDLTSIIESIKDLSNAKS